MRGEGETEHWRYKFDSSIYFRKDWKRSIILKVGKQLATTNQAAYHIETFIAQSFNGINIFYPNSLFSDVFLLELKNVHYSFQIVRGWGKDPTQV